MKPKHYVFGEIKVLITGSKETSSCIAKFWKHSQDFTNKQYTNTAVTSPLIFFFGREGGGGRVMAHQDYFTHFELRQLSGGG